MNFNTKYFLKVTSEISPSIEQDMYLFYYPEDDGYYLQAHKIGATSFHSKRAAYEKADEINKVHKGQHIATASTVFIVNERCEYKNTNKSLKI